MLTGTASPDELLAHAATMPDFDTDPVELPGAEVFQAMFELRIAGRESSLPPSLHPTNPPTMVFQVWRCPESPWGAFSLSQARVGSRSGLRPRGHVQGCVCDGDQAADALRHRWGFPAQRGAVELRRHYDAVEATTSVDGETAVALRARDPEPLGAGDVAYSSSVALAHTPRGLRIVQIDYDVAVERAERLTPRLELFAGDRFGVHPTADPHHAVSASIAVGTITLQRLRFVCRPDESAFTGTEATNG